MSDPAPKLSFLQNLLVYCFLGFVSFMVADLLLLKYVRIKFFPEYTAKDAASNRGSSRFQRSSGSGNKDLAKYDRGYKHILTRNMFNEDGVIAPPISSLQKKEDPTQEEEVFNDPVLSSLDLKLEGTIVHRNPYRSLATIAHAGKAASYTVGDEIEKLAEIISIVRKKVIFKNLSNRKLEYIEISRDLKLAKKRPKKKRPKKVAAKPVKEGLVKRDGNRFSAKRSDVQAQLSNMGALLRDAKAERAIDPVTGEVMGFKLVQIKKGSLYEQLGLEENDIISEVNGEAVTSPNKAMMLFNQLKNSDNIRITINRNGSNQDLDYSVED